MTWKTFIQKAAAMGVVTACVVVVLLVTANDPSADEVSRGAPAGVLAYLAAKLFEAKT